MRKYPWFTAMAFNLLVILSLAYGEEPAEDKGLDGFLLIDQGEAMARSGKMLQEKGKTVRNNRLIDQAQDIFYQGNMLIDQGQALLNRDMDVSKSILNEKGNMLISLGKKLAETAEVMDDDEVRSASKSLADNGQSLLDKSAEAK